MKSNKEPSNKTILVKAIYSDKQRTVCQGELKRFPGRPGKTEHLFRIVAEKLPYAALPKVRSHAQKQGLPSQGIYIAHDSMGFPRYVGRGNIFARLEARRKAQVLELVYFSFYVVAKKHEREIETLVIRSAGPLLEFNARKKGGGIQPGSVCDYEAGTQFFERHYKRGRKI